MSIAAPKVKLFHFTFPLREWLLYKIRCGVLEQRACIYLGAPKDCFL